MDNIYDINVIKRDESVICLNNFKGKVLLIFNSATGCGFTPQYEAIESLYKKYHDQGLEVLDFPCNQFGHQAPGSDDEIHQFCTSKYNTTFEQYKKIDVNGDNASDLYKFLKEEQKSDYIKGFKHKLSMKAVKVLSKTFKEKNDIIWNFTKFLVSKDGKVIKRLSPIENPMLLEEEIIKLLEE